MWHIQVGDGYNLVPSRYMLARPDVQRLQTPFYHYSRYRANDICIVRTMSRTISLNTHIRYQISGRWCIDYVLDYTIVVLIWAGIPPHLLLHAPVVVVLLGASFLIDAQAAISRTPTAHMPAINPN